MRPFTFIMILGAGALYVYLERYAPGSRHAAEILTGAVVLTAIQAIILLRD